MTRDYGIHWFRRDLRVAGNSALERNWKCHNGRVIGVFFFDSTFLKRSDFSNNRFLFFLKTLEALENELSKLGSGLIFRDLAPLQGFKILYEEIVSKKNPLPKSISWNRDYEPFARARDSALETWFRSQGTELYTERDHLLLEPEEIYKGTDPNSGYQVFTPFSKKWMEYFTTPGIQARVARGAKNNLLKSGFSLTPENLSVAQSSLLTEYLRNQEKRVTIALPKAGHKAAFRQLETFENNLEDYESLRDIPSVKGTSGMSVYLKNGSITSTQIISSLKLHAIKTKAQGSPFKYLNELIWREFYYHILYRHPRVETESFLPRYKYIKWENREDYFEAWKRGKTGYPIVDAGMRQLNETGWMHNRVRMIVASFLTKDLLIDWRWGERYFMEKLLDGDLAANNGGWQWAASTGCDPQPYFRIFNPELQSRKFDARGDYIRKYVPELEKLNPKDIHAPNKSLRGNYPPPIIDHSEQREKALKLYVAERN